jgi:hypothetical protein
MKVRQDNKRKDAALQQVRYNETTNAIEARAQGDSPQAQLVASPEAACT